MLASSVVQSPSREGASLSVAGSDEEIELKTGDDRDRLLEELRLTRLEPAKARQDLEAESEKVGRLRRAKADPDYWARSDATPPATVG